MSIVQALVTALLSGLFSGAIIFALNERREREKLLLEKAELAVEAYSEWAETFSNWPITHFSMFSGDREAARAKSTQMWNDTRNQFRRAKVLIGIYLPEKTAVLGRMYAACEGLLDLRKDVINASIAGETMPEGAAAKLTVFGTALVKVSSESIDELIEAAQQRAHTPHLIRWPTLPRKAKS